MICDLFVVRAFEALGIHTQLDGAAIKRQILDFVENMSTELVKAIEKIFNWESSMCLIDDKTVTPADYARHHRIGSVSADDIALVVASRIYDIDIDVRRCNNAFVITNEVRRFVLFFAFVSLRITHDHRVR